MKYPDYSIITEVPGLQATKEQIDRLKHRYHFAKQFASGKDVVEVACGTGIGLKFLTTVAKNVVGGDVDETNLKIAKNNIRNSTVADVRFMDAHNLPLEDNSCDVILLFEAIYYLQSPEKFINEAWRVLRNDGVVLICTVNTSWTNFHPSPFSTRYFAIPELYSLFTVKFQNVKIYGAFEQEKGLKSAVLLFIKKMAVKMNLIPGSLKLRSYLKKIFIGKTTPIPLELKEETLLYNPPVELPCDQKNHSYKIIYVVSIKK